MAKEQVKPKRVVSHKPEGESVLSGGSTSQMRRGAKIYGWCWEWRGRLSTLYDLLDCSPWNNSAWAPAPQRREACRHSSPFIWRNPHYLASLVSLEPCCAWQRIQFPPCFPLVSLWWGWEIGVWSALKWVLDWAQPRPASQGRLLSLSWRGEIYSHLMVPENQELTGAPRQAWEPACADPKALGRETPLSNAEQAVWWESTQWVFCKCSAIQMHGVWFRKKEKRANSKCYGNPLKILEQLFFNLLMLEMKSEFPRDDDFTYYVLLVGHVLHIPGLGRAESKL